MSGKECFPVPPNGGIAHFWFNKWALAQAGINGIRHVGWIVVFAAVFFLYVGASTIFREFRICHETKFAERDVAIMATQTDVCATAEARMTYGAYFERGCVLANERAHMDPYCETATCILGRLLMIWFEIIRPHLRSICIGVLGMIILYRSRNFIVPSLFCIRDTRGSRHSTCRNPQ